MGLGPLKNPDGQTNLFFNKTLLTYAQNNLLCKLITPQYIDWSDKQVLLIPISNTINSLLQNNIRKHLAFPNQFVKKHTKCPCLLSVLQLSTRLKTHWKLLPEDRKSYFRHYSHNNFKSAVRACPWIPLEIVLSALVNLYKSTWGCDLPFQTWFVHLNSSESYKAVLWQVFWPMHY